MPTLTLLIDSRQARAGADLFISSVKSILTAVGDFERGSVSVAKTTNMGGDELKKFSDEIVKLSTRIPATTDELFEIAKVAGQLGVRGRADLLAFAETFAKLKQSTNVSGETGIAKLIQILNITGEGTAGLKNLADVVTKLGNTSGVAGAENQILRLANEVARATVIYHVSATEATALGASFGELGTRAESVGTTINKVFAGLDDASRAANSSHDKNLISSIMGVTPDQFTEMWKKSTADTFLEFERGLGRLGKAGLNMKQILQDLDFKDSRLKKSIPAVAFDAEKLAQHLDDARNAAGALDREYGMFLNTLYSQWQIFQNTLKALPLLFTGLAGNVTAFLKDVNIAMRFMLGLNSSSDQFTKGVDRATTILKALAYTIGIIIAFKLETMMISLVYQTYQWVRALGGGVTSLGLIKTQVLIIGTMLAGWTVGNLLIDKLQFMQRLVNNISGFLNRNAGPEVTGYDANELDFRGVPIPRPAGAQQRVLPADVLAKRKQYAELMAGNFQSIMNGTDTQFKPKSFLESVEGSIKDVEKLFDLVIGKISPEFRKAQDDARKAVEDYEKQKGGTGSAGDVNRVAETELQKYTAALERERAGLKLSSSEREIYLAERKLETDLNALGVKDKQQYLDDLRLEIELTQRLRAVHDVRETLKEIDANKALLAIHGDELEIQTAMYNMFANARKEDIALDANFVARTKKQLEDNQALEKSWKKVWDAAEGFGQGVGGFLDAIILKTSSFKDAMLTMLKDIEAAFIKAFVTQPITNALVSYVGKGLGAALGLPSPAPTPVKTYAEGGTITGPMMFQMGNGQVGLAGEAGEEEIVPKGKRSGGGRVVNQYITINTPNADSFRRSSGQIQRLLSKGLGK